MLDGRQRRTCITKLFNDPTAVYEWAKDCCGFKNKASEDEDPIDDIDRKQASSDTERAMKSTSLEILLDYILLCHNKLMKAFDFSKVFSEKALNYYSKNKNNKFEVDPIKLSKHIRALNDDRDFKANNTLQHKESFMHYLTDRYDFRPDNAHASNNLAIHLNLYWDVIKSAFDVYAKIDKVLTDAEVGFIELNDATISDAQNVFSKINSGGTQLNAAELLSAKPYWNEPAEPNGSMKKAIDCLYKKLNTEIDTENKKYCRWDIPATLLQAIDPHNLFYKTTNADPSTDIDVNEISMGFKLLSSCYVGGMSKLSLDELEKAKKKDDNVKLLDWSDNLSSFIDSFKTMVDAIYKQTSFIIIPSWGLSIYDILGAGAAMELFAGAWLKWDGKISEKSFDSKDFKCFLNGFKNHFDRLVYEKMSGSYKGSGDARMARNLKNIDSRTALITTEEHASTL